jgi:hypothetical protein
MAAEIITAENILSAFNNGLLTASSRRSILKIRRRKAAVQEALDYA